jgi:CRP-like cAMP-binding protein
MPAQSAETVREANAGSHSEGFAKSVVKYPKGTVICKEGDLVNCMYDIHWGRVGIYSKFGTSEQVQLTTLASDNFFGEMGMVSDQPRSATAVALDPDTTVEIIYPEDFKELFEKNPYKVDMILRHLSTRLRTLTNQYLDVCAKIAEKSGS